jgi:hypothetical protein
MTSVTGEGDAQAGHWGFVGHANSADLFPFVVQHGGTFLDDPFRPARFVFDDARAAEAVQWYADLGLQHRVMPIVERQQVNTYCRFPMDAFSLQQAAMAMGGIEERGGDVIPWGFDWGAVPLPHEQNEGTLLFPRGFYVAARTEHPQETWALIHSLSTSEQAATNRIPARRSVAEAKPFRQRVGEDLADAALAAFDDDVRVMVWFSVDPFWGLYDRLIDLSYWVVTGEDTADEMMLRLQDSMAEWTVDWE